MAYAYFRSSLISIISKNMIHLNQCVSKTKKEDFYLLYIYI